MVHFVSNHTENLSCPFLHMTPDPRPPSSSPVLLMSLQKCYCHIWKIVTQFPVLETGNNAASVVLWIAEMDLEDYGTYFSTAYP